MIVGLLAEMHVVQMRVVLVPKEQTHIAVTVIGVRRLQLDVEDKTADVDTF